jgi:hypothetical protein
MRRLRPNVQTDAGIPHEVGKVAPLARRGFAVGVGLLALTAAGSIAGAQSVVRPSAPAARLKPRGSIATVAQSAAGSTGASSNRSGLPWKSGAFVGLDGSDGDADGAGSAEVLLQPITDFDAWRGRPSDVALQYIGRRYFNKDYPGFLKAPTLQRHLPVLRAAGFIPILSLPLVNKKDAGRFADVAAGSIDQHHQAVADRLREIMDQDRIYLRLGWESDKGYPWSIREHEGEGQPDPAKPDDYRAAWQRIARIYRDTVPGAVMVWNTLKNPPVKWATYYPGDDVVDIISIDLYDNGSGGNFTADNKSWKTMGLGSFDAESGSVRGMRGILEFARHRGKKMALDEWAATNQSLSPTDGANNDFFVAAVFAFLMEHQDEIEYEVYFNSDRKRRHQIFPPVDYNERPSSAYLAHWRP